MRRPRTGAPRAAPPRPATSRRASLREASTGAFDGRRVYARDARMGHHPARRNGTVTMADSEFDLFVIGAGSGGVRAARLAAQRGARVAGRARVVSAHEVDVAGRRFRARHILVATGGRPLIPEVPGGELAVSSDAMFDLPRFPQRLVVVGGGYIACEMASIFRGLGAQ